MFGNNTNHISISTGTIIRAALVIIGIYLLWVLRDLALSILTAIVISSFVESSVPYFKKIKIDWKGWKVITIPFAEFGVSRNVMGWSCITRFSICSNGWGCVPNPNAEYYIDDVKLVDGVEKAK